MTMSVRRWWTLVGVIGSVIVNNKAGFFEAPTNAISVNNVTAKPNTDPTTTIHFGGDPDAPQLSPNHARLELHGPALPAAQGDPRWHLEVSRGATCSVRFNEEVARRGDTS